MLDSKRDDVRGDQKKIVKKFWREPPSNASLCARVTTLLVRQTTGSLTISAAPTERRHRCENTGPTARAELTRAHRATPALAPRADEPAAIL